jgi:periplasmic divalent cation tolerance protein
MLRVVLCNCPPDAAAPIARALVESAHAACVNIIPNVRSFYRWQGQLCDDAESTLLIKTSQERLPALEALLISLHPYELPEIIALEPSYVLDAYASWAQGQLSGQPGEP